MTATFEVLAEESRRRILDLLVEGERPVGDLVGTCWRSASRPSRSTSRSCARPAWSSPAPTRSAGSTGSGPSPRARSTSGWRRTAGNGRPTSTPWSATSRSWRTATGSRGREPPRATRTEVAATRGSARTARRRRRCCATARRLAHPPETGVARPHRGRAPGRLVPDHHRGGSGAAARRSTSRSASRRASPSTARCSPSTRRRCMELRWADDILRFELEADGPGCVLRLTVTFPEHGKAARDAAGWHVCLEQLGSECAGDRACPGARRIAGASSTGATSSASAPRRRPSGRPRSGRRPTSGARRSRERDAAVRQLGPCTSGVQH